MSTDTKRIVVFDPQVAGLSGDMIVAALLDLGADVNRVSKAMTIPKYHLPNCAELEIAVSDITKKGIHAKKVDVMVKEDIVDRSGVELLEAANKCLSELQASDNVKRYVTNSINTIIAAEAKVHGLPIEKIHLHETASVDTLADIIGTAVAIEDLGLFKDTIIYTTPVSIGGGLFRFSHGTVSAPAPATLEILRSRGLHLTGGPSEAELATPTGVSLLACLEPESVRFYPPMRPIMIGYGAGTKDFSEMPNVLRITLAEPTDYGLLKDDVYVIETNLDDTTGELISHTIQRLLDEGAKDVSAIPMLTKKGRPGHIIKILTDRQSREHLCRILIKETGTLGVRIYPCERRILERSIVPIEIKVDAIREVINVKVSRSIQGQIIQTKPEYDELKILANRTGKSLREISGIVQQSIAENIR